MRTFHSTAPDRDIDRCAHCRATVYASDLDAALHCPACAAVLACGPECDWCGIRALRPLDRGVCGGCLDLEARRVAFVALLSARRRDEPVRDVLGYGADGGTMTPHDLAIAALCLLLAAAVDLYVWVAERMGAS